MKRNIIANLLLIGSSVAWLYLFFQIVIYGEVVGREPNLIILWLEIAFFTALIVLGVSNVIKTHRQEMQYRKKFTENS